MKLFNITLVVFSLFSPFLGGLNAFAYPEYIRLGYVQCSGCHESSNGGGLLSDYGKGVRHGASLVQRGEYQANPYPVNANVFIRELHVDAQYQTIQNFIMQSDVEVAVKVNPKMRVLTQIGKVPDIATSQKSQGPSGVLGDNFTLRQLTLVYDADDNTRWVFGREFLPRSLNLEDHTAFIRALSPQGVYDYPTQIRYEKVIKSLFLQNVVYAPSFEENSSNREYGAMVRGEYAVTDQLAPGALILYGGTERLRRTAVEAFVRYSFHPKAGVMGATQWIHRSLKNTDIGFNQVAFYAEPFYAPTEWSLLSYQWEHDALQSPFADYSTRHEFSVRVKLLTELSLRWDYYFTTLQGDRHGKGWLLQIFAQL